MYRAGRLLDSVYAYRACAAMFWWGMACDAVGRSLTDMARVGRWAAAFLSPGIGLLVVVRCAMLGFGSLGCPPLFRQGWRKGQIQGRLDEQEDHNGQNESCRE